MSDVTFLLIFYSPPIVIGFVFYLLTRRQETVHPIRYKVAMERADFSDIWPEPFWGVQFRFWYYLVPLLNWVTLGMGVTDYLRGKRITPEALARRQLEHEQLLHELKARTEQLRQTCARRLLRQFEQDFLDALGKPLDKDCLGSPPRN